MFLEHEEDSVKINLAKILVNAPYVYKASSKAEQIFDQLLKEKIKRFSSCHDISLANELRTKTYCK